MIENTTSRRAQEAFLLESMVTGDPSAFIEAQEARGQRQLVNSDRMPADLCDQRDQFEALGFTFGDPDPADGLFMPATLPEGWTREGSGHAMWSYINDQHGRRRVSVFYKAAFYDRSAHAGLSSVATYVRDCADKGTTVITDSTWATTQAVKDAIEKLLEDADKQITLWSSRPDSEEFLAEAQADRAKYQVLADALPTAP